MRITISKDQLLRQLPKQIRYDLIAAGDDIPDSFEFEALMSAPDMYEKLAGELKEVRRLFKGSVQWRIFCDLYTNPDGVSPHNLLNHINCVASDYSTYVNAVSVHVYQIRKLIRLHKLPYEIEKQRGSARFNAGRYVMTKKSSK